MKLYFLLISILLTATIAQNQNLKSDFKGIEITSLLKDKISVRAIVIDQDKVFYAADNNRFGYINRKTKNRSEHKITFDTLKLEFRSIAQTKHHIFILSVGNPALLYKIDKKTMTPKLVYEESHDKVFYDSMQFSGDKNGMAMGDPTEKCLSVIITNDGGNTWRKQTCDNIPQTIDGEAAFAASNTNLIL